MCLLKIEILSTTDILVSSLYLGSIGNGVELCKYFLVSSVRQAVFVEERRTCKSALVESLLPFYIESIQSCAILAQLSVQTCWFFSVVICVLPSTFYGIRIYKAWYYAVLNIQKRYSLSSVVTQTNGSYYSTSWRVRWPSKYKTEGYTQMSNANWNYRRRKAFVSVFMEVGLVGRLAVALWRALQCSRIRD